ncbi:UNVERIFIED_ORG: hypothetical protein ABIB52_000387 [Arthrobacter sp. UYCu721]
MKGCLHPTSLHGAGQQLDSQRPPAAPAPSMSLRAKGSVKDALRQARDAAAQAL